MPVRRLLPDKLNGFATPEINITLSNLPNVLECGLLGESYQAVWASFQVPASGTLIKGTNKLVPPEQLNKDVAALHFRNDVGDNTGAFSSESHATSGTVSEVTPTHVKGTFSAVLDDGTATKGDFDAGAFDVKSCPPR
jgi:hypothetical protein